MIVVLKHVSGTSSAVQQIPSHESSHSSTASRTPLRRTVSLPNIALAFTASTPPAPIAINPTSGYSVAQSIEEAIEEMEQTIQERAPATLEWRQRLQIAVDEIKDKKPRSSGRPRKNRTAAAPLHLPSSSPSTQTHIDKAHARKNGLCFKCGTKGHLSRNCSKKNDSSDTSSTPSSSTPSINSVEEERQHAVIHWSFCRRRYCRYHSGETSWYGY